MAVVVFPSPYGPGVTAVTKISLPFGFFEGDLVTFAL